MNLPHVTLNRFRKRLTRKKIRRVILGRLPNVVHVGARAVCKRVSIRGVPYMKKIFASNAAGRACFERELAAQALFRERSWLAPVVKRGRNWLLIPWYPAEQRMDHLAPGMEDEQRSRIAKQAGRILFEIFLEGCAHRDFHSRNLFLVDGRLIVIDFEVLGSYPLGDRPAFPCSYDMIGEGLESPFETKHMCYIADDGAKSSLRHAVGTPVERVLEGIREDLKEELRAVSTTFQTRSKRHTCRAERIYSSFDLPHFSVGNQEAQRDSARRLDRFGVQAETLQQKTILDLGANVGGMLFEVQKHRPGRCVGVEYDGDKVAISTKIAAYNGLNNVSFVNADIDKLKVESLGGPFDVVFCLAIEAHVRKARRLYRLLSSATRETLYFEGNADADVADVRTRLAENGFRDVEYLGFSDDDCIAENNCRPIMVARK